MTTIKAMPAQPADRIVAPSKAAPVEVVQPQVPVEAPIDDQKISPKLLALAKKEKMQRERERQLVEREEKLKSQEAEYGQKYVSKDKLTKENALSTLEGLGLTRDQLAGLLLNGPEAVDPMISSLQAKIAELESKTSESQKRFEEQQAQSYDQAVQQIRTDAKLLIDSNPDFETIKDTGNHEAVVELIKKTFSEDNLLLTVEEAAKQIEDFLVEEGLKYASMTKVKARLTPTEVIQAQIKKEVTPTAQLKTLTNDVSSSAKPLTARERAKLAFLGQLNK